MTDYTKMQAVVNACELFRIKSYSRKGHFCCSFSYNNYGDPCYHGETCAILFQPLGKRAPANLSFPTIPAALWYVSMVGVSPPLQIYANMNVTHV